MIPEVPEVPDRSVVHPMPDQPRVVLLKPLVTSPLIEVGEYSYYDDPDTPAAFETRNVLYHYAPKPFPARTEVRRRRSASRFINRPLTHGESRDATACPYIPGE